MKDKLHVNGLLYNIDNQRLENPRPQYEQSNDRSRYSAPPNRSRDFQQPNLFHRAQLNFASDNRFSPLDNAFTPEAQPSSSVKNKARSPLEDPFFKCQRNETGPKTIDVDELLGAPQANVQSDDFHVPIDDQ